VNAGGGDAMTEWVNGCIAAGSPIDFECADFECADFECADFECADFECADFELVDSMRATANAANNAAVPTSTSERLMRASP
jgi:uncharacterized protein YjbI with pentapeptide repeats